jgi:hypothetical protein
MSSSQSTIEERQPLDDRPVIMIQNASTRYPTVAMMSDNVNLLNISTIEQQLNAKELFQRKLRKHYPAKKLLKLCLLLLIVNLNIIILEYEFSADIKYRVWDDYTFYYGTFSFSKTIVLTCFMNVIYCLLTILSSKNKK